MELEIRKIVTKIVNELDIQNNQEWSFDVGTYVGLYSWEVRELCPFRKILAFEPDPGNIKLLEKTLSKANLQNLAVFKCALSNWVGELIFFQDSLTSPSGFVARKDKPRIEQYLESYAKRN